MAHQKTFVIGDIHGAYRALEQCFERSGFNPDNDTLICLGDVCDGWPDVKKVFDLLIELKNIIYIMGNHDYWALEWMETGFSHDIWLGQGGSATIKSYSEVALKKHIDFISKANFYYIKDNRLFVHGGFDHSKKITDQDTMNFIWDRNLIKEALNKDNDKKNTQLTFYSEVFVGHTPTLNYRTTKPIKACEVWMMDTGAGWPGGVLTMMDIETKEIFQSDRVNDLYPEYHGRSSILFH